jgi:hypothetical protein
MMHWAVQGGQLVCLGGPHPDHVDAGDGVAVRDKSTVKTKARKTNNQTSFVSSLLQNNMEVEAAIEMARHLDEKLPGLYRNWVWSEFGWFDPLANQPNLEKFAWFEIRITQTCKTRV